MYLSLCWCGQSGENLGWSMLIVAGKILRESDILELNTQVQKCSHRQNGDSVVLRRQQDQEIFQLNFSEIHKQKRLAHLLAEGKETRKKLKMIVGERMQLKNMQNSICEKE